MRRCSIFIAFFILVKIGLIAQNIVVNPYLQNIDTSSTIIMWETDTPGTGFVDFGLSPFAMTNVMQSSSIVGEGDFRIHTAELVNLDMNTKYYYRVRTQSGMQSSMFHFKTTQRALDEAPTVLIAMSDMQRDGSNPNIFQEIIEQGVIPIVDPDVTGAFGDSLDAIMIPGDLVVSGGNYAGWKDHFFSNADSLFPYVPVYPVPGNHEYHGNGLNNFLKYFSLPENGTMTNLEEWWYKDLSNIRIIGLNTNSGSGDQALQLTWLESTLNDACANAEIDFVFCQFHHPHKSELWTPGESSFSGEIIDELEEFTTNCGKPSIHFFGHTHGYSRGQSRDHNHLWVNVATAGGRIDYWGEFPNQDYAEFVKTQDEYGFVKVDVEAGIDPKFTLRRYSRGDENMGLNNQLRDEIEIKRYDQKPNKPLPMFPFQDTVSPNCFQLKASPFVDIEGDSIQASQWQISSDSLHFLDSLVYESWQQNENWYNEVNTQDGVDLSLENIEIGLDTSRSYYWKVRYRDHHLTWSDWSTISQLHTSNEQLHFISNNLVSNEGAEMGIVDWIGDIESLLSNECNSVPAYEGAKMFAVGGVCQNESTKGSASQVVDLSPFINDIANGDVYAAASLYTRNFSGSDMPSFKLEIWDANNNLIDSTEELSSLAAEWTILKLNKLLSVDARKISFILQGMRNAGTDNDSYFDQVSLQLATGLSCSEFKTCPNQIVLNQMIQNQDFLAVAKDTISSNAIIQLNSNVEYRAETVISLEPEFYLDSGSNLLLLIEQCNH